MGKKKKSRKKWFIILAVVGIATLIDVVIPDPVPFIDEIALISGTIYSGYKSIK